MNEGLDEKLKILTKDINEIFDDDNHIIWLQVLLPKTYLLKQIEAYAYTLIDEKIHKTFVNRFVYDMNPVNKNQEIFRSLHYLTFDKPYQYNPIQHHIPINNFSSDYKLINDGVVITDGSSLKEKFSQNELLENFWPKWCDEIKNFAGNSSTLWSYIEIPDIASGEKKILSYYVVFKNSIECKNTQSRINKILQSFLIGYGLETYSSELRKTALQSSLSAVMSRNQSHNIGSHVLNNLSNPEKIKEFLYEEIEKSEKTKTENNSFKKGGYVSLYTGNSKPKEKKRYYLTNPKTVFPTKDKDLISEYITKEDLYPENLIAHFNTYLKSRMDFIGDVGTSVQASLMNTSNLFDEVFAFFEKNLILLREISGKEDEFQYGFSLIYNGLKNKTGPQVAMPNGLLGQQAFYIILENIIRNTAKHEAPKEKVNFHIAVDSCNEEEKRGFYQVEIFSDIIKSEEDLKNLICKRNLSINLSVLGPDNTVRSGGWGTIEMKLAAAYLCGVNLLNIDNKKYQAPLIREDCKEEKDGGTEQKKESTNETAEPKNFPILEAICREFENKSFFGYRFYVQKPKVALVVFDNKKGNKEAIQDFNEKEGVYTTHKDDQELQIKIFNHDFLVLVGEEFDKDWHKKKNLPQRILRFNTLKKEELREEKCWEWYYDQNLIHKFEGKLKSFEGYFTFDEKIYYFDRHGRYFHSRKEIPQIKYIEPFGQSTLLGHHLGSKFFKEKCQIKLYQCIESVASKIMVIDERAQSARDYVYQPENRNGKSETIPFYEIFDKTGLFIPSKTDINLIDSDLKSDEALNKIYCYIKAHISYLNYLVLHYGIVEILEIVDRVGFLETIDKLIENNNPDCKIVIVSGRGQTKDIPQDYIFINHSTFSYFIANQFGRSKLHLVQLLKSGRQKQ